VSHLFSLLSQHKQVLLQRAIVREQVAVLQLCIVQALYSFWFHCWLHDVQCAQLLLEFIKHTTAQYQHCGLHKRILTLYGVRVCVFYRCEQLRPEACSWIAAACSQLTALNVTDCTHVSTASVKQLTNGAAAANGYLQSIELGNCKNLNLECLNSIVQLGGELKAVYCKYDYTCNQFSEYLPNASCKCKQ
jgi:hypothetical protein